ncbi:MAG: glycoside hydrolase family 78 protein [Rhodobacteraceae bacterium]|nr:glycoside hydrolase family 78 protein [Paracoccaceae bacterium]
MSPDGPMRTASATEADAPRPCLSGEMIAPLCDAGTGGPACFVAREFDLDGVPEGAVLHLSAQGLYRAFLNGHRVGLDLLTPGWTCYDDRIAYQSYPVSDLLRPGRNRLEIWLGDGWFRSRLMWASNPVENTWGDRIAAFAELVAGGRTILRSDASWRSGVTPVTANGIYHGEDHDARIKPVETHGVEVIPFDRARLVPHETGPVREMEPVAPIGSWAEGAATVFDFGQNCAACARITVQGPAGAHVRVEFAEVLGPGRVFDNRNFRSARAEQRYTLRGGGIETWAPMFTYFGFRYARVTLSGGAQLVEIRQVPVTSVPRQTGRFTCALPEVDRLVLNTVWSQRSNFIEIPTDCPQRDERLGWTGDAQVFAGTACWLADCESFLRKYLRDVRHDQRPNGAVPHFSPDPTRLHPIPGRGDWAGSTGWGDAIVIIPWQLYLHYGDRGVLAENYPAMLRWLDYLWSISDGPVIRPPAEWGAHGFTFGDWLQPVGDNRKPRPTIADDCAATIYHFISTDLTARIAAILGDARQATALRARAAAIREAFAQEFFAPSGRIAHNDQTSWALAFLHDLVPPQHREAGRAYFRRAIEDAGHLIGTGFIGTPALLPALTKLGMTDLAEAVFLNRRVPGWLYQIERGATTIWERWDAIGEDGTIYDPDMNSYNHYAYGAVCQWLFESVAGVAPDPERPGFEGVLLDPVILPALGHVEMSHDCRRGRIGSAWRLDGRRVHWQLSLPPGCTGRLLPRPGRADLRLDGERVSLPPDGLAVPPGAHAITFERSD